MKILLVDLPVHAPTIMPYSIAMMYAVLSSSLDEDIEVLDLNAYYHFKEFKEFYSRKKTESFFPLLDEFIREARHRYAKTSKIVVEGKIPPEHDYLMKEIIEKKPDVVAFSITYNSQVFFGKSVIEELLAKKIKVILGGPGDYSRIQADSIVLENYNDLLKYLLENGAKEKKEFEKARLDYSSFQKELYFTNELVYPIRTSFSCPYKRCAFCTHHQNKAYELIDLDFIKDAIISNNMKKVFFIDDNFTIKHLKDIAGMLKPMKVEWWCQLRPIKELIPLFPELFESGLRSISWGVESGSQRVLDFMDKGTNLEDIELVLAASEKSGIKNLLYIMFGFPTETKEEAIETVRFMHKNKKNIDLISTSTFGLQKGSRIFNDPEKFGVKEITYSERSLLGDKINYIPLSGMTQEEAESVKKRYAGELNNINKLPRVINGCKEQILNL